MSRAFVASLSLPPDLRRLIVCKLCQGAAEVCVKHDQPLCLYCAPMWAMPTAVEDWHVCPRCKGSKEEPTSHIEVATAEHAKPAFLCHLAEPVHIEDEGLSRRPNCPDCLRRYAANALEESMKNILADGTDAIWAMAGNTLRPVLVTLRLKPERR